MIGKKKKLEIAELKLRLNSLELKYELIRSGLMFNTKKFNTWFNSDKDWSIYAHSGIFLRLDKLSQDHFVEYIISHGLDKENALEFYEDNHTEFMKFEIDVRNDWQVKQTRR